MSGPTPITPAMAKQIELWPVERLVPYAKNARTHSEEQIAQIAASIAEFGFNNPVLVDTSAGLIAGHGRVLAARKLGLEQIPVVVLDHLSETQKRAFLIADNRISESARWDDEILRGELAELKDAEFDLALLGFSDDELEALLAEAATEAPVPGEEEAPEEDIAEAPVEPVTRPGDVWLIGDHRLICGDCRDYGVVARLFDGARANVVITSPPYATQREYDPASGFKPVPPEEYAVWFSDVAANIRTILAPDGSYFLNIKEHAADGERHLYVKDLIIAHKRQWGWRFVDEFCWRKTDNGVPGGWGNRFKNAWEPVFHLCIQPEIKFRPQAVGHVSGDCFDYSPDNPVSRSGSGLLGTGPRGASASLPPQGSQGWGHMRRKLVDGRHEGIARPSNVIEAKTESGQGSHSAPFPRALVEFFVKAFSDAGDIVFDPFLGSGTTIAAAHVLGRKGYGCEISPAYCDVILRRIERLAEAEPELAETGTRFGEVAEGRGVPAVGDADLRQRDSRSIRRKPNGMPCYGPQNRQKPNGAPVFVKSGRIR
ncbi:MAG TPA: DNA methyltransferase [Bryobacteraceae bacterium]|nr:DNA methyltransferase [Bryobacteraceae bacterium]